MSVEQADQVAAVCYRWQDGQPEFLLIRTSGHRWMFPKGGIDHGESEWQAAQREAHEEAGVAGQIEHSPLIIFRHLKRDLKRRGTELKIAAYLMHVDQQYASQEKHRQPSWFTAEKAQAVLAEEREFLYAEEARQVIRRACEILNDVPLAERHASPELQSISAPNSRKSMSGQADCFISYSRQDSSFVDWLVNTLSAQGFSIWLDRNDIQSGEVWDDRIDAALRSCAIMLLILSPAAMNSSAVSEEWKFFLGLDKPVLPLLLEACDPHFRIAKLQYIDFRTDRETALSLLTERMKDLTAARSTGGEAS
jgi:8-oxo-dGTP pyrophosphatase MutT (NUDIX family)